MTSNISGDAAPLPRRRPASMLDGRCGVVGARLRALPSLPCRLHLCAALAAFGVAGILLGLSGTRGDGAAAHFRPGGMALEQAGEVLTRSAHAVEGCVAVGSRDGGGGATAELNTLFEILTRSATARAVIRRARGRNVHVCLDERTDLLAYYFAGVGVIGLSAGLSEGGKIAFLAHELGHVPQHPTYSDNRYYPPDDLVLLRRVREAVAEAVATRIVWELREAGYPAAWNEKSATPYGDVARAFEAAIRRDDSETGALRATRAAFDRWFAASWRRNVYDRMTVDHLERISSDDLGLVPPRRFLDEEFLQRIAALDGRNFLAGTSGRRLTDPYYGGMVSSRNATRLERVLQGAAFIALPLDPPPMADVAS